MSLIKHNSCVYFILKINKEDIVTYFCAEVTVMPIVNSQNSWNILHIVSYYCTKYFIYIFIDIFKYTLLKEENSRTAFTVYDSDLKHGGVCVVGNLQLKTNISIKVLNVLHPWQITAAVNSPAGITKQHFTAAETGMQTSMRPLRKMCSSPQHLQSQKLVLRKL